MANDDDRRLEVLPIPDVKPVSLTTYDAKDPDTKFPPIRPLRPPAGAPNVLIILLDDVGFGASSAFGGPCQTPNASRQAGSSTPASTPPRSARRRARRCSRAVITTRSAWAASPRSRPRRP